MRVVQKHYALPVECASGFKISASETNLSSHLQEFDSNYGLRRKLPWKC